MIDPQRTVFWRFAMAAFAVAALAVSGFAYAGTDAYHYDAYGRLTGITYADGSSITYTYDNAGNRTVLTQTP